MRSTFAAEYRDAGNDVLHPGLRRWSTRHWVLVALVGCIASLALAPSAFAATGSIEGTVTESGHKGLTGVSVTVYNVDEEIKGTTTTNVNGEYTVGGLPGGSYKVGFSDRPNYADQYYQKQASFESASLVPVAEGNATAGIDAEMMQPGKIAGRVTNSAGAPVADVSVEAYTGEFEFIADASALTNANGEYVVEGLPEGTYKVGFSPSGSNYLSQYYNGQETFSAATPVLVSAGTTTLGINVTLVEGGRISGTVTDAYAHTGLSKIEVTAQGPGGEFGFALTNDNGEYAIAGLRAGSYKVRFSWRYSSAEIKACEHLPRCPPKYVTQYFANQLSEATATPVGVLLGVLTPGVNAAMVPSLPFNTAGPSVSGTPTVGSLLSCSSGSWTGEPELALSVGWPLSSPFSYQWLRDGAPVGGATSSAYVIPAADVGHALVCEVTASNVAGHTSARSAAVVVTAPAVTLSNSRLVVSGGSARVPIACANATCRGTIEIVGQVTVKGKDKKAKKKTAMLAKGSYTLPAGTKATVFVRLTSIGKSALAAAKAHKLSAKAGVTVASGTTVMKSVVLREAPTKGKRK